MVKNYLAKAEIMGLIPGLGIFHMPPGSKAADAPHLLSQYSRDCEPQLLKLKGARIGTPKQEKTNTRRSSHTTTRAYPQLTTTRKSMHRSKDPAWPKLKRKYF